MKINQFLNQVFIGDQVFDEWDYDETYSSGDRELLGLPYSLVCTELEDNTVIAHVVDPHSPHDFMQNNGRKKFSLDSSAHPRYYKSSMNGSKKKVFYSKIHDDTSPQMGRGNAQFTLNIFKNGNSIFGAPENNYLSPMHVNLAFEEIDRTVEQLSDLEDDEMFQEKELGSFFYQVNFINEKPYRKVLWKTKGISYQDLKNIIKHIYNNIPAHMK